MSSIRWGIIGTGDVADRKGGPALYLVDRSQLVAATSRTLSKADSFAARHGNPEVFENVDGLLAAPIDAVYIATPPNSHAEITERVAMAGKHVLCEKPMAMSVAECERMIAVCKDQNVSLGIAYYRRYFPVVQKMKQLVDDGSIGKPLSVLATSFSRFRSSEADPWRLNAALSGGGFLMDVGTHRFDLMAYFFGSVKRVRGVIGGQALGAAVEDAATVSLEFENGIQGSATFQWNCAIGRDEFVVVGTDGILSTDSLSDAGRLQLETTAGTEAWQLPATTPVHQELVQRFVQHLLDGAPNPLDGKSGMVANAIVQAVYETAN